MRSAKMLTFDMNSIDVCFFYEVGLATDFCLEKISNSDTLFNGILKNLVPIRKGGKYSKDKNKKLTSKEKSKKRT